MVDGQEEVRVGAAFLAEVQHVDRGDKALDRQTPVDLLWIRDDFLESEEDFGKVVVHGHSVTERPEIRDNRIGIDTGACYTNALTCLVLQGNTRRFLSTGAVCDAIDD